jgi:energy-coupling factor transporter ATP-binding protein EcfA2
MKLRIENFGPIKKSIEIEPKPLTVFCGANNTGKTYALYVLNALMDSRFVASFDGMKGFAKTLNQNRSIVLEKETWLGAAALRHAEKSIADSLKEVLQRFFVADEGLAENAKFAVSLNTMEILTGIDAAKLINNGNLATFYIENSKNSKADESAMVCNYASLDGSITISLHGEWSVGWAERMLNRFFMQLYCPDRIGRDFLLPAERSGINLFFRELNSRRATLLRHASNQLIDTNELLKDIIVSRYPQPIQDYIEFLNNQPEIKREQSEFSDLAKWLQKEVLKVVYKINRSGDISIAPLRSGTDVGLHLGSSTVKTFFGLWSYLNHLARKGDWLMIDEPELNLHPRNQRMIARLLAQLVNRGIRVVVSTHSDYMVREWSNLIMLSQDFEGRDALSKQHHLPREQWLDPKHIAAYEFDAGGAAAMNVSLDNGIRTELFDESINDLNNISQSIYFGRQATAVELTPIMPTKPTGKTKKGAARD